MFQVGDYVRPKLSEWGGKPSSWFAEHRPPPLRVTTLRGISFSLVDGRGRCIRSVLQCCYEHDPFMQAALVASRLTSDVLPDGAVGGEAAVKENLSLAAPAGEHE